MELLEVQESKGLVERLEAAATLLERTLGWLEDRQRVPQLVFGVGGAACGPGAPAQAGQRVRFLQDDAELAG